jgi:protein-tyrosine-phosphatase
MSRRPQAVLFACGHNAVRSPMAEAIAKHLLGKSVYVDSVGVRAGEPDAFAAAAMAEIGLDISRHRTKSFDELADTSFDLIVTLSPEAQHRAVELTRTMDCQVEYWPTFDPSGAEERGREAVLDAYRGVRDGLFRRIQARFGGGRGPTV